MSKADSSTPHASLRRFSLVVALLLIAMRAPAAVIVVDEACGLVDAITAANTDTAVGECSAGLGRDEIRLTVDVSLSEVNNVREGANGLPRIISEMEIRGVGEPLPRTISRDSDAPPFRFFDVGRELVLRDIHLTNGSAADGVSDAGSGGAIRNLADVFLYSCQLTKNSATGFGGAIHNERGKDVIAVDTTFSRNSSVRNGGAILNEGDVFLTRSTIEFNRSGPNPHIPGEGYGAGIMSRRSADLIVHDSTFSNNSSLGCCGGAIYNEESDVFLTNTTVSGNSASLRGGGISNDLGVVTLKNCTLLGNSATGYGVAIDNDGPVMILDGIIVGNSSGGRNCGGSFWVEDLGNNLIDDDTCISPPTRLVGVDLVLADNGGPTMTHALLAGSNAVDLAGDCGLATDQRLAPRRHGSCDAGAFEFRARPTVHVFIDGFESGTTLAWSETQ